MSNKRRREKKRLERKRKKGEIYRRIRADLSPEERKKYWRE